MFFLKKKSFLTLAYQNDTKTKKKKFKQKKYLKNSNWNTVPNTMWSADWFYTGSLSFIYRRYLKLLFSSSHWSGRNITYVETILLDFWLSSIAFTFIFTRVINLIFFVIWPNSIYPFIFSYFLKIDGGHFKEQFLLFVCPFTLHF
jgi:hypothetical protein